MQAYDPDARLAHWGRIELWTSPFTTDPAQLQPKRLGVTGKDTLDNEPMVVGAGLAAHNVLQGELPRLYRLTDGAHAFAPAVPGLHLSKVISIDDNQILFWASLENAYPTDYITIVRMPLSSLGPFQPLGQCHLLDATARDGADGLDARAAGAKPPPPPGGRRFRWRIATLGDPKPTSRQNGRASVRWASALPGGPPPAEFAIYGDFEPSHLACVAHLALLSCPRSSTRRSMSSSS